MTTRKKSATEPVRHEAAPTYAGLLSMSADEWFDVPDHPIQRDTARHLQLSVRRHLASPSPTHARVAAARYPDGRLEKLDGHTRATAWHQQLLPAPKVVMVDLYDVANQAESEALYKTFDNPSAAESASDRLAGAYRKHGISPQSRLLTHGGISSALRMLASSQDVYAAVQDWKEPLQALDALDLKPETIPSTLAAAALCTLRRHPDRAGAFWLLYSANGGERVAGRNCGVQELRSIVELARARGQLGTGGRAVMLNQVSRAISCCEAWLSNRTFSVSAKPTNLSEYLARWRNA